MSAVHNAKSRTKDFYDGAPKGRARLANHVCSWYVLILSAAMGITVSVKIDLQTVICQVLSVSRDSVAAAKLQQPSDTSLTIWWLPFKQA